MGIEDLAAENATLREKLSRYEALAKALHGKSVSELEREHEAFAALCRRCRPNTKLLRRLELQQAKLRGHIDLLKELHKCLS